MGEKQRCTNPGNEDTHVTKFCTMAATICGFPVWDFLCVTLLAPTIFRLLLDSWKIHTTLAESVAGCQDNVTTATLVCHAPNSFLVVYFMMLPVSQAEHGLVR
jgi:hypothetical protein